MKKKKKLSTEQKILKGLLSGNGSLKRLDSDVNTVSQLHKFHKEAFDATERLLVVVAEFQDKCHKKMDKIKTLFKDNEEVMIHFGPLHNHIKQCGRDIWKSEKHKSFVQNKAEVSKKNLFSRKVEYGAVSPTKILFRTDFYDNPIRLKFIHQQRENPTSPLNEAMIKELDNKLREEFLNKHISKIQETITALQDIVKQW